MIFAYYGIMLLFESLTKGGSFPAEWARWMPNIVLVLLGHRCAIRWRMTAVGTGAVAAASAMGVARSGPARPTARPVRRTGWSLVIRIPDIRLPRPRLLDLYVAAGT